MIVFKMTKAILIHEDVGHVQEIDLDITPVKNEIFKLLGGRQTFIGQWPDIDVVIMKAENATTKNGNILPDPFDKKDIHGKILLVRMDENSQPQDFTLDEYNSFCVGDESVST
tara:strand:- start:593 stop:931 length:339 start_codon:yes stop_codon:yes gene_type:complete